MCAQKIFAVTAIPLMRANSAFAQSPSPNGSAAVVKSPLQSAAPRTYSSPCCDVIDVCDVLAKYASLTHFKIIRDNFVQGKVSIVGVSSLQPEKAIEMIDRTLFSDGFAITQIDSDAVEVT